MLIREDMLQIATLVGLVSISTALALLLAPSATAACVLSHLCLCPFALLPVLSDTAACSGMDVCGVLTCTIDLHY